MERSPNSRFPRLTKYCGGREGRRLLYLTKRTYLSKRGSGRLKSIRLKAYAMLIVYRYRDARTCYELNKDIMMEVMIPDRSKFEEFDKTGVPWNNIVAFVGHSPPNDVQLIRMIQAKGTCCMVGTSRNLDRQLAVNRSGDTTGVAYDYRMLLKTGADLIETDLPHQVARLLYRDSVLPASKSQFFRIRSLPRRP